MYDGDFFFFSFASRRDALLERRSALTVAQQQKHLTWALFAFMKDFKEANLFFSAFVNELTASSLCDYSAEAKVIVFQRNFH